jgi:hypothetical protein
MEMPHGAAHSLCSLASLIKTVDPASYSAAGPDHRIVENGRDAYCGLFSRSQGAPLLPPIRSIEVLMVRGASRNSGSYLNSRAE